MNTDDKKLIGYKNGFAVYVSDNLIHQKGEKNVLRELDMVERFPVVIDLSGNTIMVEADSHEEAISRWLTRISK